MRRSPVQGVNNPIHRTFTPRHAAGIFGFQLFNSILMSCWWLLLFFCLFFSLFLFQLQFSISILLSLLSLIKNYLLFPSMKASVNRRADQNSLSWRMVIKVFQQDAGLSYSLDSYLGNYFSIRMIDYFWGKTKGKQSKCKTSSQDICLALIKSADYGATIAFISRMKYKT